MVRYISVLPFNSLNYYFFSPLYHLKQFVMADISMKQLLPMIIKFWSDYLDDSHKQQIKTRKQSRAFIRKEFR